MEADPTASPRYALRDATSTAAQSPSGESPAENPRSHTSEASDHHQEHHEVAPPRYLPGEELLDDRHASNASPQFNPPPSTGTPAMFTEVVKTDAAPVPSDVTPTTYVTVDADSFWNISKLRYGGEGKYFKALYYHNRNRILRPDQIPAGIEIETPSLEELKRLYPDLCGVGQRR